MKATRTVLSLGLLTTTVCSLLAPAAQAQSDIILTEVPDYAWHGGCFGTASGNLAGYWDRHGYPDIYTGPTGGGLAPLGEQGGIRALWTSQAGLDGRPADMPGHTDDYYVGYESTGQDPYITFGRPEHTPDCIGDFIGLSQNKWSDLNGECRGNIDAFSFVFWDKTGNRRVNHYTTNNNVYVPDIGSGLKEWMRWRGYDADVFTQLSDFNPERTTSAGFTYEDVKREISAGNPVLCFLQRNGVYSRSLGGFPNANPEIHGVMIFGYFEDPLGGFDKGVYIKTSWGQGTTALNWSGYNWLGLYPVRGVIGFRPKPKVKTISRANGNITLTWEGPASYLYDNFTGQTTGPVQRYVVQRASRLTTPDWKNVSAETTQLSATVPEPTTGNAFYRVVIQ